LADTFTQGNLDCIESIDFIRHCTFLGNQTHDLGVFSASATYHVTLPHYIACLSQVSYHLK